ncbi:ribonuclease P, partial [Nanoarchaeota archaeon NZ13-N]
NRKIAIKRIKYLYKKSLEVFDKDPDLSRRYIKILLEIKRKANIKLIRELRNKFCKKCYTVWIPGKTLSIRVRRGKVIYKCLNCGYVKRFKIR